MLRWRSALVALMLVSSLPEAVARGPKPKKSATDVAAPGKPAPTGISISGTPTPAGANTGETSTPGTQQNAAPVGATATPPSGAAPASAAPPPAERRRKIAVLELSGLGVNEITQNLEQYLRNSLATIEGTQVISSVDLQMALQDPKNHAIAACGGGPDCAVKIGKLVAAEVVIIGSISGLGDAFSLNLRALDVARGKELARYQANVSGRDKLIPEVRLAAYRLVAPERIKGWLVVDIATPGVGIDIDGAPVGTTPLTAPLGNLSPGRHVVIIKWPGYLPLTQDFVIRPFEPTKLTLALDKVPK